MVYTNCGFLRSFNGSGSCVCTQCTFSDWIERSLIFLVVSCPCALVLSVPLSFFGGLGAISKLGVMVKGTVHLETMAHVKAIAFDKTGTLTKGKFNVVNVVNKNISKEELLKLLFHLKVCLLIL